MTEQENKDNKIICENKGSVHVVLTYSYLVFLLSIISGVFLDTFIKKDIFSDNIYQTVGIFMLLIGSIIIYWAQSTSSNYVKFINRSDKRSQFEYGPYRYLRSPTHFGLFVMTLGFSLIIDSFFSVVLTIIAYTITKIFFLKKEENLLEKKYGEVYGGYKKKVKNWI